MNKFKKKKSKFTRKAKQPAITLKVLMPVRYIDRGVSALRVEFAELDGQTAYVDIEREHFRNCKEVAKTLLSSHAAMPDGSNEQVTLVQDAYADRNKLAPTLEVTSRVGWHQREGEKPSFVYYTRTFGPRRGSLTYDNRTTVNDALGLRAGTLDQWKQGIASACQNSDYPIFTLGIAAAGPLLEIVGAEAATYHLHGAPSAPGEDPQLKSRSSSGKTLAARLASSTMGRCERTDLFSFDMTDRSLEENCFGCNSLSIVVDEEGRVRKSSQGSTITANTLAYKLTSGTGKRRSKIVAQSGSLPNLKWLLSAISTGEHPLDGSGKAKRNEGEEVRMVQIPVPATHVGGIFHRVRDKRERTRLADQLEQTITENFGLVMPAYLKKVVANRIELEATVRDIVRAFTTSVGADSDSWERRFASKFAIVAAGACLLARFNLAPWTEAQAHRAVVNIYNSSRGSVVSIPQATANVMSKLRKLVLRQKHFVRVTKGQKLAKAKRRGVWGVIKVVDGHAGVLVLSRSRFKKLVRPSAVAARVLEQLNHQGDLILGGDGKLTRQLMVKALADKKRYRYVCIRGLAKGHPRKT